MPVFVKNLKIAILLLLILTAGCSYLVGITPMSQELHKVSGAIDKREVEWTF